MNFKNFAFCLVVILCSTTIVANANAAVAKNGTSPGNSKLIIIPTIVTTSFSTVLLEDVIETYEEKLLLQELIRTELSLLVIRAEELGLVWITALGNEIINELLLFKNMLLLLIEELTFSNIQIKYLIARTELQLDRQYQVEAFHIDAAIVPYIRRVVYQIRRFITVKLLHQKRLRLLLHRFNKLRFAYTSINRKLESQLYIDEKNEREAAQSKVILDVAAAIARDFFKYEIIKDNYYKQIDTAELTVTEVVTLVSEFYLLNKMAALHAREVEAGVLADILRQINFVLISDERHQIHQLRIVDPRRFIEIKKAESILYPIRRKLRHMLAAIAYHDGQIAKKAWELEGTMEILAVNEMVAATWDYTVLNWNCLGLMPL